MLIQRGSIFVTSDFMVRCAGEMHAQEVTVALGDIKIYFFYFLFLKNRVVFKQPMKNSSFYNHSIAAVSKIVPKSRFCLSEESSMWQ